MKCNQTVSRGKLLEWIAKQLISIALRIGYRVEEVEIEYVAVARHPDRSLN